MRYINYLSDFEFYQELANAQPAPFELTYYIPGKEQKLIASYDGEKYTNCRPDGDGIIVSVDYSSVQLGIGKIRCTARYYLDNEHYTDGIYEPVSDFEVGIELHRGESDDMGDLVATPLPLYTRGEKGDPLTYDDLTEEEKEDLASRVKVPTKTSELTNDSGYVTATKVVAQSESVATIQPNVLNVWGEVASLDITLAEPTDNTIVNEYMVQFTSGATATTLTLPNTIKWMAAPNIQPNKTYQLSIVNNLGVIGEFSHE